MALFKRNDNKDQAAEDLAEGMAEDLTEGQPEDTPAPILPRASAPANANPSATSAA